MKIKYVLFDLDGTLLPMDQDEFFRQYFKILAVKLAPYGYEPKRLVRSIWNGVVAMSENDGSCYNEEAFWSSFSKEYGKGVFEHKSVFEDFYKNEFQMLKNECGYSSDAIHLVKKLREKGLRSVVATKPIFPDIAIRSRIDWAGFSVDDFALYTTYEEFRFCKPNPAYYTEIAEKLGVDPQECLMVGNDVSEDMPAREVGMKVFLLTDCLINEKQLDVSEYPQGHYSDLEKYIESLI